MADLSKIRLFRMVHVENVPHILANGLTLAHSEKANDNYVPIGNMNIIGKRSLRNAPNGKTLNEFIPFYFWYKMPMLLVIQTGYDGVPVQNPENIVYCITNVERIIQSQIPFFFTNGHALIQISEFFGSDSAYLMEEILDFEAIKRLKWVDESDLDLKRRKEAEFLVEGDIPSNVISGWVVYNEKTKGRLIEFGIPEELIVIRENFYF
ncbi:type II toxin-antitoxin system toxin DNA ADP-ribosyl transferase DarT [Moheibacter sediminis]|uniref:DarT domain-containing protein n=1 Tax=Moheibacter sediminis TaxID=1434700 RepID=A0A1W1YLA7_9FLAO|nr:DUF4433 domain-containing protein [Moheibacter sediminis]SMC37030.1 protein of unknown function [Moheibacter sediminis]